VATAVRPGPSGLRFHGTRYSAGAAPIFRNQRAVQSHPCRAAVNHAGKLYFIVTLPQNLARDRGVY